MNRYDGSEWTTFTTADGLAGDTVFAVIQAADGTLWFATRGGVSRFDGGSDGRTFTTADGLVDKVVNGAVQTAEGPCGLPRLVA